MTIVLSLLVLAGLVVGIVFGGQWLYQKINPVAADYTGSGSGEVDVRVESGDSLTAIARTLQGADVIASTGPFVDAASANPASASIQPGVYSMALQMSGQAALDRLLDPASRLFSRVTLPEGLRVDAALQRIADSSQIPLADLQAAAADPAALGLPAWANGMLEGHLFPATYDIEPGQTAVDVLTAIVARGEQTYDSLGIPEADRLRVLTEASLVQAEAATTEDMSKVATVINNRIAIGMPLQFDTTVNYATGKTGITTTAEDRPPTPRTTPTATRACRRGPSTAPARRPCRRCSPPPRATGCTSSWSTPTPATPGSPPPPRSTRPTSRCSSSGCARTRVAERAAVLGRPITHSLSPVLHRAAYAALGLTDWTYEALDLGADELPILLAGLSEEWRGFSVTMPCKQAAAAYATESDPLPRLLGAANTLVRVPGGWRAENTDVTGVGMACSWPGEGRARSGTPRSSRRGTASAAAVALASLGAHTVDVVVRDPRARPAWSTCWTPSRSPPAWPPSPRRPRWPPRWWSARCPPTARPPSPASTGSPGRPCSTCSTPAGPPRWPAAVEAAGGQPVHGLDVLFWQATVQVELITGRPAPIEAMRTALDAAVPR